METVYLSLRKNTESLPDWSAINHDLLVEIAVRVPLMEDFMAFRGVCTSWRTATSKKKFKSSAPRVPLLMLPEKDDSNEREFYSLPKKKICMRLSLPQLKGRKCFGVGFGWILTLASSGKVSLLNPLSGAQIEVPNYRSFSYSKPDDLKIYPAASIYDFIRKAVLSANPSDTSDFVLMVLLDAVQGLGTWRAGGKSWLEIKPLKEFDDIACYNNKFYGVKNNEFEDFEVWVWDPSGSSLSASFVMRTGIPYDSSFWFHVVLHLVESSEGKLLLITRHDLWDGLWQNGVTVLDVQNCQWKIITDLSDLEEEVVFLGRNTPMSIAASTFPDVVQPHCIYFPVDGEDFRWPAAWCDITGIGSDSITGCESLWIAPSS